MNVNTYTSVVWETTGTWLSMNGVPEPQTGPGLIPPQTRPGFIQTGPNGIPLLIMNLKNVFRILNGYEGMQN